MAIAYLILRGNIMRKQVFVDSSKKRQEEEGKVSKISKATKQKAKWNTPMHADDVPKMRLQNRTPVQSPNTDINNFVCSRNRQARK
jgi:hypothetical protein